MTSNILQNVNPKLFLKCDQRLITDEELNDDVRDLFDEREVFGILYSTQVDNDNNRIEVLFTPTIPHCSLATLIGLTIRVQLLRSLPSRFKVRVKISPGTHNSENAINKQLGDKERVAAAMENSTLLETINNCIATVEKTTKQF
ncbi:unnamed protein product [Nezara viridula]|uniref:MIP18 family-like domain-containing protein n=1 Tax=Nezara viridula TaxID=85310 RepID=A0A9P0GWS2_NEZVI|nr:unnamed protein product [Nezara viridula]